jgi:hypothetical protein
MSLDKAIEFGKEKRKQYRKSKAFDRTCRNHGKCPWCEGNRTFQARKEHKRIQSLEKLEDSEEVTESEEPENFKTYGPFQNY